MSEIQAIVMPKWGLAMQDGMIASWHIEEGADINTGDEIMDIETSKITNSFESPASGVLRRIVVREDDWVPVGALLAVVAEASVDDSAIDAFIEEFLANFDPGEAAGDSGPEAENIDADGQRIRFLKMAPEDNNAEPLLLIHGFGGDLNTWMFTQPALAEDRPVYALDLPGHGGSNKNITNGDRAELGKAVLDFMDAVGLAKAHLVGHSLGGAITLALASEHAERILSATLICPAGLGPDISMAYIDGFIAGKRGKKLRPILEMLVADPGLITGEMVEEVLKYKRLDGVDAALKTTAGAWFANGQQSEQFQDRIASITVPIQVIWGSQDQIVPAKHADGLPDNIKITQFSDAGHLVYMEKSSEVIDLINTFVN